MWVIRISSDELRNRGERMRAELVWLPMFFCSTGPPVEAVSRVNAAKVGEALRSWVIKFIPSKLRLIKPTTSSYPSTPESSEANSPFVA